jgi:hypothetical protein
MLKQIESFPFLEKDSPRPLSQCQWHFVTAVIPERPAGFPLQPGLW